MEPFESLPERLQAGQQASSPFITGWSELERHFATPKVRAYDRMLHDFGVDPHALWDLRQQPRLLFAEQPGCWFSPRDLIRYRLLRTLVPILGLDPNTSGIFSLADDACTATGDKKILLWFKLHADLGPVSLLGSSFLRRHRRRTYRSLRLTDQAHERVHRVLTISLQLLEAAALSPRSFSREATAILGQGVPPGLRALLPPAVDARSLAALGAELQTHDLVPASELVRSALHLLRPDLSWASYWDAVNRHFLSCEIRALAPWLNRFVLAIHNPLQLVRQWLHCCPDRRSEPLPLVGVITEREEYRMVFCDPKTAELYFEQGRQRQAISWAQIRELAQQGQTGGPSGTLEYLCFAACGFYLLVDTSDGVHPFHSRACAIHQHYTGLKFPWITFPLRWPHRQTAERDSLLDVFSADFPTVSRTTIWGFLNS